jgi:aryl-alcohol dehydrogenase-like predicted oxidoreductase
MEYRALGASGLVVSRLAFGVMTFGKGSDSPLSIIATVEQAQANSLVAQAFDAGINYFNTADVYAGGASEEMLGAALGKRRGDAVIGTKVGLRMDRSLMNAGLSRRHVIASCEASLRRLGTDWIDLYLAHVDDALTPQDEVVEAFEQLVRDGKIRYSGFSNWAAWRAATVMERQRARGYRPLVAAELYYSLLGRDVEAELLPFAAEHGIGVTVWSPLAAGLLTGRYRDGDDPSGRLSRYDAMGIDRARAEPVIDAVLRIAKDIGSTPARVAISWLLSKQAVASVLLGASTPEQFADTLGASAQLLDAAHLAELDALSALPMTYPHWANRDFADHEREKAIGRMA